MYLLIFFVLEIVRSFQTRPQLFKTLTSSLDQCVRRSLSLNAEYDIEIPMVNYSWIHIIIILLQ